MIKRENTDQLEVILNAAETIVAIAKEEIAKKTDASVARTLPKIEKLLRDLPVYTSTSLNDTTAWNHE